jgi:hypothetical protein
VVYGSLTVKRQIKLELRTRTLSRASRLLRREAGPALGDCRVYSEDPLLASAARRSVTEQFALRGSRAELTAPLRASAEEVARVPEEVKAMSPTFENFRLREKTYTA